MRVLVPLIIVAAGFAAVSTFAFARGEKPAACNAAPSIESSAENCTASAKLCENWLKGRATFRATFPKASQPCG
jgi:hypothetical protein